MAFLPFALSLFWSYALSRIVFKMNDIGYMVELIYPERKVNSRM